MTGCEGLHEAELLELPPRCSDCPALEQFARDYQELGHQAFHLAQTGETLLADEGIVVDIEFNEAPPEIAEAVKQTARQTVVESMDSVDTQKDLIKQDAEGLSRSCEGVIKLRGARKGLEYTVAVCASARAYLIGDKKPTEQPAHVWIRTKPE